MVATAAAAAAKKPTASKEHWLDFTDLVFWLPTAALMAAYSANTTDFYHYLTAMMGLSAVAAILYSVPASLTNWLSGLLKWRVMPLVFLRAVTGTWFGWQTAAFVVAHALQIVLSLGFRPAEPVDGKLRILLAGDAFEPKCDGVAVFTTHAVKCLQRMGHTLHVACSVRDAPLHGVPVTRFWGIRPPQYPEHSLTMPSLGVFKMLWEFKPHCVHLVDENFFTLWMQLCCLVAGVPAVWSHHTRMDLYAERVIAWILWKLGISDWCLHLLRRLFCSVGQGHMAVCTPIKDQLEAAQCTDVTLWHSGCDVVRFHPSRRDESREPGHVRWKVTNGRPDLAIALYVGRLAPEKTLDVLPELMDLLNGANNEHPTVQLVIVGDGPCRPETEALLMGKLVTFMGHMPQAEELWTLYASADMFFSPSTTEAFALVFLEAMASGLPVCGPDAGGIPEAFTEGREGFLYRPIFSATDAARAVRDTLAANAKPRDGSHPHIRDLARLHAESLSWDETYRQACAAYMRAWRAVVGPAPIDAASSYAATGSLEKTAAGCSAADSNAVLLSSGQQAAQ